MSYLNTYGKKRRFQEGGGMPQEAAAPGPEQGMGGEGGGQEEQIVQLAEATVAGDEQAAAQLGMIMAPMLLEQIQAAAGSQGGMPAGPEAGGGQPVFRRGGKFVGVSR